MTETTSADWHRGDWMQTHTGVAFYPLSPRAEDVSPLDIAHSLAMQCRYNGHVKRFYSVAEHCVLMADFIIDGSDIRDAETARELALWALLHDAAEAYIGDMVRPLKLHMPAFRRADDDVTAVIADRFGLVSRTIPPEVKAIDTRILLDERAALLGTPPGEWTMEGMQPLGVKIHAWDPERAKREYMLRLVELRS